MGRLNDNDHPVEPCVAFLQIHGAQLRLGVCEPRYELQTDASGGQCQNCIDRTLIARERNWHLEGPSSDIADPFTKAPDQRDLSGIP